MKYCLSVLTFALCVSPAILAQSTSPQGAVEEMVTTDSVEIMRSHLPLKVLKQLDSLDPKRRAEAEKDLLVSRKIAEEGVKLRRTDDANVWEVVKVEKEDRAQTRNTDENGVANVEGRPLEQPIRVTLKSTFISGPDALLVVEIKEKDHVQRALIGLHLEDGNWRFTEVGTMHSVESDMLRDVMRENDQNSGAYAASMLRKLNTTLVVYSVTYPNAGYAPSLTALSGSKDSEPTKDHAKLLDPSWMEARVIKNGYEFEYVRVSASAYRLTATPVQLGVLPSYFTDETAVIRSTKESRPANENDPPL